jgi:lipopolysaccharide/colanic/teichoic acid biosynthesis glycosyltransferase
MQPGNGRKATPGVGKMPTRREGPLSEETFHAMLSREHRRAERSRKPFVLIQLDLRAVHRKGNDPAFIERLSSVVSDATRETDIVGWYEEDLILGVIFTEVNLQGKTPITEVLYSKVVTALRETFDHGLASKFVVSAHLIPEHWDMKRPDREPDLGLYEDHSKKVSRKRLPIIIKRVIDILGSSILLLLSAPVLAAIALAIKFSSKGPVIFRQERVGRFGMKFKCLKFRTMYADNDPKIHREYVQRLISGKGAKEHGAENGPVVYKITSDPRVTPIGRFLRKTSLDEFPQFWNVLRGEMSLVGPRPAVPYEFELYDVWHCRRILDMKPGVTGLWQVSGRSRVSFDDMVRLDVRYSQRWSLWLDLKILLATPHAALKGDGAF